MSELRQVSHEIRILLWVTAKNMRYSMEQTLAERNIGVSMLQVGVLRMLSHGEQTISEISKSFTLDPSTLVPSVDALERKGLISRKRNPTDRRRVQLSVTEEGLQLLRQVSVLEKDDLLTQSLSQLGADRAQELLFLMRELVSHLPEGEDIINGVQSRMCLHDQPEKPLAE